MTLANEATTKTYRPSKRRANERSKSRDDIHGRRRMPKPPLASGLICAGWISFLAFRSELRTLPLAKDLWRNKRGVPSPRGMPLFSARARAKSRELVACSGPESAVQGRHLGRGKSSSPNFAGRRRLRRPISMSPPRRSPQSNVGTSTTVECAKSVFLEKVAAHGDANRGYVSSMVGAGG
ncbi:hypothetical protein LY76DRAFT_245444 [Colletotrichum caudatum]|nr:hypothetical protein LY76DRAFT_245444 [Colletotrichum caudatum]